MTATTPAPLEAWRAFFPAAALLAALGLALWAAQLSGVPLGIGPRDHAAFLLWGALGSGVHGFLLTAYPKQNDAPLPAKRVTLTILALQIGGAAALLLPRLPTALKIAATLSWPALLAVIAPIGAASLRRRWDATTAAIPLAIASGWIGALIHAAGDGPARGIDVGLHAFLTPLALSVLDRVLPFFSSRVTPGYRGQRLPWFTGTALALGWARALTSGPIDAAATALLCLLLIRQWYGWQPWPAAKTPMIGILHIGIAWLPIGWSLDLAGAPPAASAHAIAVGALGSLLLGISMRVARGHSGLPIQLGRAGAAIMLLAQAATLTRVVAAFQPSLPLWLTSATLLGAAFALWLLRFSRLGIGR